MNTENQSWDPEEATSKQVGFMTELWQFVWENKIWWMAPTLLILAGLITIIVIASESAIAPFFYALF